MKSYEKLKLLREEKGLSVDELVKETGLSAQAIRNYENSELDRLPNTTQLKTLKDYFGVSYEYLLDEDCLNRTHKSVDIGKKLKLSDTSIERIIDLQNHDKKYYPIEGLYYKNNVYGEYAFNSWLESFDEFKRFNIRLDMFYNLNKIMELSKYFINLLSLEDKIEKSFNSDKLFITKLNNLLISKMDEFKDCFINEDKNDFLGSEYYQLIDAFHKYTSYLKTIKKIPKKGLFLILDDLSSISSTIYEDTYKNIKYCQYELSEIIKNNLVKQTLSFDLDSVPPELENIIKGERK